MVMGCEGFYMVLQEVARNLCVFRRGYLADFRALKIGQSIS